MLFENSIQQVKIWFLGLDLCTIPVKVCFCGGKSVWLHLEHRFTLQYMVSPVSFNNSTLPLH